MEKKFFWVALGLLSVVVIAAGVGGFLNRGNESFNGSVISPPIEAPKIALSATSGEQVKLTDFRGKIVLIFFGFTNCLEECPTTMAVLHQVRTELGDNAGILQVLLITTDPTRDTKEKMAQYLSAFDPTFLGLTGTGSELGAIYQEYGVTVLDNGETHSSRVYLVDQEGLLRLTFPYGMPPDEILHDVRLIQAGD